MVHTNNYAHIWLTNSVAALLLEDRRGWGIAGGTGGRGTVAGRGAIVIQRYGRVAIFPACVGRGEISRRWEIGHLLCVGI